MVVYQDECGRRLPDGLSEYLARMDQAGRKGSLRYQNLADHAMATVEQKRVEALLGVVAETLEKVAMNVRGSLDSAAYFQPPSRQPAAELVCGDQ
jgi:hypothetical protein